MENIEQKEDNKENHSKEELIAIENDIKQKLTNELITTFNKLYDSVDEKDKKYFNNKNIAVINVLIDWNLNVNTVKVNKGEISTNSLLKFYHYIFNIFDEENQDIKEIFESFKLDFTQKMNIEFIKSLNEKRNKEKILKYDLKNGYINVYLTDKCKSIVEMFKKDKNTKKTQEINNSTFTVSINIK